MADPTPVELQQQIDELKELITTTYEPPTGDEYSYPVVNQPMNDEMWAYVTRGLGDGVLDEGGQPYWLRGRENVNNTVRITVSTTTTTAQAVLRGFYHKLTADKTFTVPGVSATTVYNFCLTYDPTASTSPGGPISLQMYAGAPPTTLGRFHVILWKLTRSANQLLTDATVERVRPKVAPVITVDELSHRPDPSKVLWGTRCLVSSNNAEFRATGSSSEEGGPTTWTAVSDPEWVEYSDTPTYVYPGFGYRRAIWRQGNTRKLRGNVAPRDGSNMTNSSTGYLVFTLPASDRPAANEKFICAGSGNLESAVIAVIVYAGSGEVRAYPLKPTSWVSLSGINWTVA